MLRYCSHKKVIRKALKKLRPGNQYHLVLSHESKLSVDFLSFITNF